MMLNPKLIIKSGSNSNGSYIKFANGTMICYGQISYKANADFTQDSSIWLKNIGAYTFPIEFVEKPYVNVTLETISNTRRIWSSFSNVTKSGIENITAITHWNASDGGGYIHIIAIGKWK